MSRCSKRSVLRLYLLIRSPAYSDSPDLVKAHIAVEPNGPPFYDIDFKGGDDWYKDSDKIARFWGVARLPLAYDPPAADASELHLARQKESDEPVLVRCWLQAEP